jgi:hypothetical protein
MPVIVYTSNPDAFEKHLISQFKGGHIKTWELLTVSGEVRLRHTSPQWRDSGYYLVPTKGAEGWAFALRYPTGRTKDEVFAAMTELFESFAGRIFYHCIGQYSSVNLVPA